MKSVLTIVLFFFTTMSIGQFFTIDTIAEKSPYFPGDIYRFPILNENDKELCQSINSHLVKNFLEVEYRNQKKSIFENVWGSDDEPYPIRSELSFEVDLLNDKIYSLTIGTYSCGAYCEVFEKSYNYDLELGSYIELDSLVHLQSKSAVLKYLSKLKSNRILKQLSTIELELLRDTLGHDMRNYYEAAKDMYEFCLIDSKYSSFEYFDYSITKDSVMLSSGRCSSHFEQALDEIDDFIYQFKITNIQKYLSPYVRKYYCNFNHSI
jgi:hypothetical protein